MPILKFKHLISFSSEDLKHPAENILEPETYHKWTCASGGERQASLSIQLEKASHIQSIDIGNNRSAFVEVLVGRSSWAPSEEFKVLLVASSFMSPSESKAGKETNRVRMFGPESLTKTVADEKWDQIKIVCTQPYNLTEPYGLSFIRLHSPPEARDDEGTGKVVKLGRFKLKSNSDDDEDSLSSQSFFDKKLKTAKTQPDSLSAAASARQTPESMSKRNIFKTNAESTSSGSQQISLSNEKRNQVANTLLQGADDIKKNSPFPNMADKTLDRQTTKKVPDYPPKRKAGNDTASPTTTPTSKRHRGEKKTNKLKKINISFNKILDGVIFVLSGFQNPERGEIRDQGLKMGAKYALNWTPQCTHLICAFANTPKFHQVKGKGKIVTNKWFQECEKFKRRVNTKSYRLDGGGESSFESSSEEETAVVQTLEAKLTTNNAPSSSETTSLVAALTEVEKQGASECDTDDELEKLREIQKHTDVKIDKNLDDDPYGGTTEEEDGINESSEISEVPTTSRTFNELPEFFENKVFFFYGAFDAKDKRLLKRYITAYLGSLEEYMSDAVQYVITMEEWDDHFDQALKDNPCLVFVKPIWIIKCHEKQNFISYGEYEIKPP